MGSIQQGSFGNYWSMIFTGQTPSCQPANNVKAFKNTIHLPSVKYKKLSYRRETARQLPTWGGG